jgi:hypothetical protein
MIVQDYMGLRSTGGADAAMSPWAWFSSPDQRATTTTRAPETLPLFPTGDDNHPRPRQGDASSGGGYYLPDIPFWGAAPAATAAAATTTTTVTTIQQHQQLLQMQQQYSFYSNSIQLPSHETQQDTAAGAGASLELSLSSWCPPYHAGTM